MKRPVLILGATSAIARGSADALAARGHDLYLAGRDLDELGRDAADLSIRYGIEVLHGPFDALDRTGHTAFVDKLHERCGPLAGVVLAIGELGDPEAVRRDPEVAARVIEVNLTGPVSILTLLANHFEAQGFGFIMGIGSVAGDRGRQSNYPYGAAKGGLALFLGGLRNRLSSHGVRVVTVKPGFVDTAMTWGMSGLFLVADPIAVGRRIARAAEGGGEVIYLPGFWRLILWIIRAIPERVFKRMSL